MSVNTAHASNGVLIHAGEYILLHSDSVTMDFSGQDNPIFKGSKQGRIYLTSHRMIFNNKKPSDVMQSFSAPFIALSDVELEQPVFGANYIKGKVRAQQNGNFVGEVKFKLHFKAGGAIEYGQALSRAAATAQSNLSHGPGGYSDDPPPYTPSGAWHEAPPPAYQPPPGYYGWLPTHDAFSGPAPNTVFMSDNPPPYPGIGGPPAYNGLPPQQQSQGSDAPAWNGFSAPPSAHQQQPQQPQQGWGGAAGGHQPPPYGAQPAQGFGQPVAPSVYGMACDYGGGSGFVLPGYGVPQPQAGYGVPQPQAGYGPPQAPGGYPAPPSGGPAPPPQAGGYNPGGFQGYQQPAGGAMGFSLPPPNSKEAEAMGNYNNPYNQRNTHGGQGPSDQPPSYNDLPPPNYDSTRKNQ